MTTNEMQNELDRAEQRIERLEEQLHNDDLLDRLF